MTNQSLPVTYNCVCKRDTEPCHCSTSCICWCCVHSDTDPYQLYVQYAGFEQNQGLVPSTYEHWLQMNPGLNRGN